MGPDASIYSMIRPPERLPGPLDQYGAMMQLRALAGANDLNELQRRKLTDDLSEETAFKSAIADWVKAGGTGEVPAAAMAASPTRFTALEKARADTHKSRAELLTKDRENFIAFANEDRKLLPTIKDDAGWQAYMKLQSQRVQSLVTPEMRNVAMQHIGQAPATYNPEWIRSAVLSAEEQFKPKVEKVDVGGRIEMVDTNPFTNQGILKTQFAKTTTPGEQLSAQTTQRGQDLVDARTRDTNTATAARNVREDADNLRKEFEGKESVKRYRDVVPIVEAARAAPDTRAGDIQLAYAVGKVLDPTSVVREGELKLTGNAATLLEKFKGELSTLTMGTGRLTPATRNELVSMLDNAVKERQGAYETEKKSYQTIVDRRGYNPADVFVETASPRPQDKPQQPGAPKTFEAMPDPAQYNGRKLQGDDGTVYKSDGKKWVRVKA